MLPTESKSNVLGFLFPVMPRQAPPIITQGDAPVIDLENLPPETVQCLAEEIRGAVAEKIDMHIGKVPEEWTFERILDSFTKEQVKGWIDDAAKIFIKKINPAAPYAAAVSELINTAMPNIEANLIHAIDMELNAMPRGQNLRPCSANDREVLRQVRIFSYLITLGVFEAASLPGKVIECYSQLIFDGLDLAAYAATKAIEDCWRWKGGSRLDHVRMFLPQVSPPALQKIPVPDVTADDALEDPFSAQVDNAPQDQLPEEQGEQDQQNPVDANAGIKIGNNVISFTPKNIVWPKPDRRYPLLENLGGSFSIVSNGTSSPSFSGQLSITVGSGRTPTPAQQAAMRTAGIGPYANTDNPYSNSSNGGVSLESRERKIQNKKNNFCASYNKYLHEKQQLNTALKDFSDKNSLDDFINKSSQVVTLAESTKQAGDKAMQDAFELHKLVSKDKVKKYTNGGKAPAWTEDNRTAKRILRKEFKIPHHKHLERGHLSQSATLRALNDVQAFHATNLSIANQDKEIMNSCQQFRTVESSIVNRERSDQPVDQDKLSADLATLEDIENKLVAQIADRKQNSHLVPLNPDLENLAQQARENRLSLANRDARCGKIWTHYQEFCALDSPLHSQIAAKQHLDTQIDELITQSPDNHERNAELRNLKEAAASKIAAYQEKEIATTYSQFCALDSPLPSQIAAKQHLDTQIDELITQSPDNHERNAKLVNLKKAAAIRIAAHQDKEIVTTYNQFCELQSSILDRESSDEPVDLEQLSKELIALKGIKDKVLAQIADRTTTSPQVPLKPHLTDLPQEMQKSLSSLANRDARYGKIFADYRQLCALDNLLLPQAATSGHDAVDPETLSHFVSRKEHLDRKIDEFIAQAPENKARNAELKLIRKDAKTKVRVLSFCLKSFEEQTMELSHLRNQIQGPSIPGQGQKALDIYHKLSAPLFFQLASHGNYKQLANCFHEHLHFLSALDSLSPTSVDAILQMNHWMKFAVSDSKGTISPESAIQLLEKLEQKHFSAVVSPLCIEIGELIFLSDRKDDRAKRRYQECQRIQPNDPKWPTALASCHLYTLHYSSAEQSLEEALCIDPKNPTTYQEIRRVVMDKYENFSLLLDWIHTLTTDTGSKMKEPLGPKMKKPLTRLQALQAFISPLCKTIHTATHLLTHPSLLKKWAPQVLPTHFQAELITVLEEDTSTNFNVLNATTFATRVIPIISEVTNQCVTEETHPKIVILSKLSTTASNTVQYLIGGCLAVCNLREIYTKYQPGALTFAKSGLQASATVLNQLTAAVSIATELAPFLYGKGEFAQQRTRIRTAHPYLYQVANTLGSPTFSRTLNVTQLLVRSRDFVTRAVTHCTGKIYPMVSDAVLVVSAIYFIYGTRRAFLGANTERDALRANTERDAQNQFDVDLPEPLQPFEPPSLWDRCTAWYGDLRTLTWTW